MIIFEFIESTSNQYYFVLPKSFSSGSMGVDNEKDSFGYDDEIADDGEEDSS